MAAVGSIIETRQEIFTARRPVRTCTLAWTCSAGGVVSGIPTSVGIEGGVISGEILRVVFIPAAAPNAPTAYGATLTDAAGIDILDGLGTSLSATVASQLKPGCPFKDGTTTTTAPIFVDEVLTLGITGAGVTKQGTVVIYYR